MRIMQQASAHPVFANGATTVFEVMTRLAREYMAINLGQGFPDHGEPPEVLQAAAEATLSQPNQYAPMMGVPDLRKAVASHAKRFYDLTFDPGREVMVTSGATEALAAAILTFVSEGDEVVVFEPTYDSYVPMIRRAGGIARPVRLRAPDWRLDKTALETAFTEKTRVLLLNNPMNPVGRLFDRDELTAIARLCAAHDVIAIADEVYEHLAFDGASFTPLITCPDMRTRTVRIGSAGKTFSVTGWKVGYITAAPQLLGPISRCHQLLVYTTPGNLQYGVAKGLGLGDEYFEGLNSRMQRKRDLLTAGLLDAGFEVLPCQGTYFLVARIDALADGADDVTFCRDLTREAGVAAIPISAFYESTPPHDLVRFCFAKKDDVLQEALIRIKNRFGSNRARGQRTG